MIVCQRNITLRHVGITLLALSFALNASLLLQAHKQRGIDRAESNSAPIVLHRKPSRNYDQWLSADAGIVSESLQKADLTREESQNLAIFMINERFQEKEGALLRIDDPWLTLDEIYDEGTARIEALREAELERRNALQEATAKPWAEVDLDNGWSRRTHIYLLCALNTSLAKPKIRELGSIIAEGFREAQFAKAAPFGITTRRHIEAVNALVKKSETELRLLFSDDDFATYFKPLIASNVYDVWSPKERFGRDLTEQENDRLLEILMPKHPLNHTFGYRVDLDRPFLPKSVLPDVRNLVGDETFSNLLKMENPNLGWSPDLHLQMFEVEQQFLADCRAHGAAPSSPPRDLVKEYLHTVSTALGNDITAYIATDQGAWLNLEITHE